MDLCSGKEHYVALQSRASVLVWGGTHEDFSVQPNFQVARFLKVLMHYTHYEDISHPDSFSDNSRKS